MSTPVCCYRPVVLGGVGGTRRTIVRPNVFTPPGGGGGADCSLPDPILYLPMTESDGSNRVDLISGYSLSPINNPPRVAGVIDFAAEIGGRSLEAEVQKALRGPNTTEYRINSGSITWNFWLRLSLGVIEASDDVIDISKASGPEAANIEWEIFLVPEDIDVGNPNPGWILSWSTGLASTNMAFAMSSLAQVENGWHMMTIVIDRSSGTHRLYVDAVATSTNIGDPQPQLLNVPLNFQIQGATQPEFQYFHLSDFGMWNEALSQCQVGLLYNGGDGNRYPFQ